jgi:hypothetical protein
VRSRVVALLLPALLVGGLLNVLVAPQPAEAATASYQPALPVNAAFYYAVEREAASRVHKTKTTDYNDVESIRAQIADMQYAGQQVGLFSWFGRGSFPDKVFGNHLRAADDSAFRWSLLAETEGGGKNPSSTAIRADLDSIWSRFGQDASYFRVGGKPVLFVYGDAGDTCNAAARWRAADSANRFYLVMKTVAGYTRCSPQPQSWYGYDASQGGFSLGNSYNVSPGFYAASESRPRLSRSVSRFAGNLRSMKAAKVRFRLTASWNEWSQATSVASATEWKSSSGHGAYADQMHSILGQAPNPPSPPGVLNAVGNRAGGIDLSWSATTGATSYQLFRNGCLITTTTKNTYTDSSFTDSSASYFVKAANFRGTSRRGPVRIGVAGTPTAAPASSGRDGMVAIAGERIMSTATGVGTGCASRQRGQALLELPSSVPADATAVVLDVTSVNAQGVGAVQVFAAGGAASISQLRYYSSRAATNTVVVPIGTGRQVVLQESGAATHLLVDVIGYTAPGEQGLVPQTGRVFLNTASSSASVGGTPTKKMVGTRTIGLPSVVPVGVKAVQVRVVVSGADGPGTAQVFNGDTPPGITSLAYDTSVILTNSVLVPVTAGRTVSVNVSRNASVVLAVEGWTRDVADGGQTVDVGNHVLAASTVRHDAVDVTIDSPQGGSHVALLNVGVASALGYGSVKTTPDGDSASQVQTASYGPQQPQSGFTWARIPANGLIHLGLTSAALVYVDSVATA